MLTLELALFQHTAEIRSKSKEPEQEGCKDEGKIGESGEKNQVYLSPFQQEKLQLQKIIRRLHSIFKK